MQAEIVSQESNQRKLHVKIGADEMQPFFEEALNMYREEVQIEGFRKGKAPKSVVQTRFAAEIESQALPVIIEEFYKQAIKDTKTEAIAIGEIDNLQYKKGEPMAFDVTVEIMPEYSLTKYKGLTLTKEVHEITPEEIEATLKRLQENYATTLEAETVAPGNFVTCDVQALDDGNLPIIGKRYSDRRIPLTTQYVGQDMIDGLTGAKVGESRIIHVDPSNVKDDGDRHFEMTVRKIEEVQLPSLDDEFAKDLGFDTIEALKADVTNNLKNRWEEESKKTLHERVIDEIIKENDLPSPEPLVHNAIHRVIDMLKQYSRNQKIDEAFMHDKYRPAAIRDVKWQLAKKKLIELESIAVDESDMQAYREKIAKANNVTVDKVSDQFKSEEDRRRVEDYLLEEKLFDFIQSHATITEAPFKEPEEKPESALAV
ncbi:trigger factor [bacterium]|nr:trigger factor [bacterium]